MSFFSKPSISTSEKVSTTVQASFIDILYDHERYLRDNNGMIAAPMPEIHISALALPAVNEMLLNQVRPINTTILNGNFTSE
jgi:hypothetical protein